jgi:2-oxoglutarate dehydrogenase E2 component (dihydrolipoamide succinyltransferase)
MTRQVEIRAPAEQTEGTRSQILRWLKSIGDVVSENEPLIEIETDKVTVEVPSPGSGTLREIVKQEQEEIVPGDLLGTIEASGGGAEAASTAERPGAARQADSTTGRSALAAGVSRDDAGAAGDAGAAHAAAVAGAERTAGPGVGPRGDASCALSPAVRRLLAEHGLEPSEVRGTGQDGRITVADVLAHAGGRQTDGSGLHGLDASAAVGTSAPTHASAHLDTTPAPPSHRVPHTATRKRIAEHMVQSLLHTAPHVTTVFEADLSAVLEHRQKNKDEFARRNAPLTLTAYFLQATVAAIHAVPEANSRWTETALEVFDSIHVGIATAMETGLVVPVLRDVHSRDLFETAQGLDDLVSRAREGRLSPADMRGGTFTISNHGVSGSLVATPIIINQPQSAILGVGKLEKRPVVVSENDEDRLVIRPRCYVTLTIDHRVMDGHQANRFLQVFVERLASPQG